MELKALQARVGTTFLFVTHDQDEALELVRWPVAEIADRRRAVLRELRWDLLIVVGQPALAAAEIGTAGLGTALVRLVAVLVRTLSRGGVLKRTWRKVVDQPLKLLVGGVPFLWLLFSAIVLKAERSYGPRGGVHTIGEALWWGVTTMATVGYGDIAPRSPIGRVAAGMTMVAGIGAFAVLTAKMAEFLLTARDRSAYAAVDASGHTLLLGWSAKLITIIRQLVEANASRTQADVVVLSPRPKRDVEREIHTHIPELARSTTTLTCRTGSPRDVVDLARVRPESARAIVVVEETPTATSPSRTPTRGRWADSLRKERPVTLEMSTSCCHAISAWKPAVTTRRLAMR